MERVCAFSFDDRVNHTSSTSSTQQSPTLPTTQSHSQPLANGTTTPRRDTTTAKTTTSPKGSTTTTTTTTTTTPTTSATAIESVSQSPWRAGVQSVQTCVKGFQLFTYDASPVWLKDNKFILTGYRVNVSWKESFHSLCRLHNETFNVWTHFVGFVLVALLLVFTMSTMSPHGIDHLIWDHMWNNDNHDSSLPQGIESIVNTSAAAQVPGPHCPLQLSSFIQQFNEQQLPQSFPVYQTPRSDQPSVLEFIERFASHVPTMAEVARSMRDQAEALNDMMHVDEVQKAVRLQFHEYTTSVYTTFATFRHAVHEFQRTSGLAALDKLRVAREMLASSPTLAALLPAYDSDVSSFARTIVQSFTQNYNATGDVASAIPLPGGPNVHTYLSRWPIVVFMISAMLCLLFSAIFHLFTSVSEEIANTLQSLDFAGICLLTAGSNVPLFYYGFYCAPVFRNLYITIMIVLGGIGFFITTAPKFRGLEYRGLRAMVFIVLGLSGVLPFIHLMLHHWTILPVFWYVLVMGFFYLGGAFLYAFHIPERYFPGKFDIFFHSHQLWHVCVFLAVCAHYLGLIHFYQWRMQRVCEV